MLLEKCDVQRNSQYAYYTEIAKDLRVSEATLHRWRQQRATLQADAVKLRYGISRIDDAINILAGKADENSSTSRRLAILRLLSWLRWPNNAANHQLTLLAFAAAYVAQKNGRHSVASKLDADSQHLLLGAFGLDVVADAFSDIIPFPDFEEGLYDDPNDLRVMARIGRFLLVYERDSGKRASLNKASFLLEHGVFGNSIFVTSSTLRKYWDNYAPAVPFLFVQEFDPQPLPIDHRQPKFAAEVDRLLAQNTELSAFLRRCCWATRQLDAALDRRAARRIRFAQFPSHLMAEPVIAPPIGSEAMKLLSKSFKR